MKLAALLTLLSLGGCATVQDHPYATSVAVALVAGSIAASVDHGGDNRVSHVAPAMSGIASPSCASGACK